MSKPQRSYGGVAGDRIQMQVHVDDQETLRKLTAADPIDEAEVLSLAKQNRIPANPETVRDLTRAANTMRVTIPADDVLDGAATFADECKAVVRRLADKIANLQDDLDKLVGADPAGEGFIRFRGDGGPGVIEIDTARLARFRAEADQTALYLRDWSARTQVFRKKTLHGDIMMLVQLIERGSRTKLDFGNEESPTISFIKAILVRAEVIREKDSNCATICRAITRYRGKVKELKNNQSK
jgi:hypothetical protein